MGWMIRGSPAAAGIFLFIIMSRPALGPIQPPIPWVPGVLSLGVKRPGREADHSPPSSAEVKNASSYTSAPQYAFMAWWSVKKISTVTTLPSPLPLVIHPLLLIASLNGTTVHVPTCNFNYVVITYLFTQYYFVSFIY
jgi:hypothetical protein